MPQQTSDSSHLKKIFISIYCDFPAAAFAGKSSESDGHFFESPDKTVWIVFGFNAKGAAVALLFIFSSTVV